jgi:hypothetical protein
MDVDLIKTLLMWQNYGTRHLISTGSILKKMF